MELSDFHACLQPTPARQTYLGYLLNICSAPKLNSESEHLRAPVEAFVDWLEAACLFEKVWFPSIQTEIDLRVQRIKFLQICGDIAKHNFSRLDKRVADIEALLRSHGVEIEEGAGYLVLPEFFDWFHTNVMSYHATTLAEHLNNLRWGIFEYLQPEFLRSYERPDPNEILYRFNYPAECRHPLVRTIYWDLMNAARRRPYFPRFSGSAYLKGRY